MLDDIPASGWGFHLTTLDDRTFLLVTDPDWTSTTAYELDVDTGTFKSAFTAAGWIYDCVRGK